MSMYSSYTPEDFNHEEDIFGIYQIVIIENEIRFQSVASYLFILQ